MSVKERPQDAGEQPDPSQVIMLPVTRDELRAGIVSAGILRALAKKLTQRLTRYKKPPQWLAQAAADLELHAPSLQRLVLACEAQLGAQRPVPFRPTHLHMLGYVALLLVFVIVYTHRPPKIDLSTPCLAYNAIAAEHELDLQRCDAWGQFDFPQSALQIGQTLDEMRQLQEAPE